MKNKFFYLILILSINSVSADVLHVAVAANFIKPIKILKRQFEAESGHRVMLSVGATGQLYAQIKHGAPYDVFLAADTKRPKMLIREAVADSFFIYAIGKLVLWNPRGDSLKLLTTGKFRHLAIAKPKLAPYGKAAKQALIKLGLWRKVQGKLVQAHNIGQNFQFIATGSAELGFVALSQVVQQTGSYWQVPDDFYRPIKQAGVILKNAKNNKAAQAFMSFLASPAISKKIVDFGYMLRK
ncbi:molybdate ABC transporter substrate-binding protein [Candidatus Marithrix sp. Canyon 246]|uniref:molybdate ABC transporter substrate-binding protein n=1 Tax=Candidatus Marithrix sp. Canyon 246 TaxID=1827136 RepID=UPI00084A11F3|nr:molybdate ABC transporter substrate-binding protein [Candidatus Marithrix sp. Canyon 246]